MDADQNVVLISVPSVHGKGLAPPGKHVLHAYTPGTEPYSLWEGLDRRSKEYRKLKEERSEVDNNYTAGVTFFFFFCFYITLGSQIMSVYQHFLAGDFHSICFFHVCLYLLILSFILSSRVKLPFGVHIKRTLRIH